MNLSSLEYGLVLRVTEALHSSLDLRVALDHAVPLLRELVSVDHIALAVSRPGTLYDYEWLNNTLPEKFLGNYPQFAEHDFVRAAVASRPNEVVRDHEMISRQKLHRHVVYTHSREAGANLEHVMAVMLLHEREWSSGLSLYRSSQQPFSDHEAEILQLLVPQIANAVRNSREHSERQREALLEPVIEHAGLAVLWLDASLREVTRTPVASRLLERYFEPHERRQGSVPEDILDPLRAYFADPSPEKLLPEHTREQPLSTLRLKYLPLPDRGIWAVVMSTTGIDRQLEIALEQGLPPRLLAIAASLVRGLSNEQIAQLGNTKLSTVKQQVSEIYRRLGVRGRKGLIQLTSGLSPDEEELDA
jgi:DNA-binding CsgD family transcriptional regulator/GAF domain-containing protein